MKQLADSLLTYCIVILDWHHHLDASSTSHYSKIVGKVFDLYIMYFVINLFIILTMYLYTLTLI